MLFFQWWNTQQPRLYYLGRWQQKWHKQQHFLFCKVYRQQVCLNRISNQFTYPLKRPQKWKVFKANLDKYLLYLLLYMNNISLSRIPSTIGWVLWSSMEKLGWFGKLGSLETSLISKIFVFQINLIFPYCFIGLPTYGLVHLVLGILNGTDVIPVPVKKLFSSGFTLP